MREILFRGKTKDGRWVYGDLVRRLVETTWQDILGEYQFAIAGTGEREKTVDFKNKRAEVISCTTVDPATVGQFTGLCDKNGVKIFEGDIVKTHYANAVKSDFIETVVFHNGRFCANSKICETGEWWTSLADGVPHVSFDKSVYMESCKVIGNIHDTPELAKEEAE